MSHFASVSWKAELEEYRERQEALFASASLEEWALLECAFVVLDSQVAALREAGAGPLAVLSPEVSHLVASEEYCGLVERFVYGRRQAVGDDWAHLPRWRSWRCSTFNRVPSGQVHLFSSADDRLDDDFLDPALFPRPWGQLVAHVPPLPLPGPALEAYQVLCRDFLAASVESGISLVDRRRLATLAALC